jgi:hypothetical protein
LVASAVILIGCSDGPQVLSSTDYPSPDSKLVALLESVNNGLGFGLGLMYDEVHIRVPTYVIRNRGEDEISTIFYIEKTYTTSGDTINPSVEWIDAKHLLVKYPNLHAPGKALTNFGVVNVEYQPFATL